MTHIPTPDELSAAVTAIIEQRGPRSASSIYNQLDNEFFRSALSVCLRSMVEDGALVCSDEAPFVYALPPRIADLLGGGVGAPTPTVEDSSAVEPDDPVCWTISRNMELFITGGGEMIKLSAAETRELDLFLRRIDLGEGQS